MVTNEFGSLLQSIGFGFTGVVFDTDNKMLFMRCNCVDDNCYGLSLDKQFDKT